jgi:Holliday junction DNA helicase RuvA
MIARLRGEVIEAESDALIVLCAGVGYHVYAPHSVIAEHGIPNTPIELYTTLIVREDEHILFGFANPRQRRLFQLLRDVKGCGPKISLALISTLGENGTVDAIAAQNPKAITAAPGIGARMAERIILELKDKVLELNITPGSAKAAVTQRSTLDDQLTEALLALGYRRQEFEDAANQARAESDDLNQQVLIALRHLKK